MKMIKGSSLAFRFGVIAVLVSTWAGNVQAQPDPSLKPTFGEVTLKSGFVPDPYVKAITSGGSIKTNLGGVNSHVAKAPDFRLHYTKGAFPNLYFHVKSAGDTTLLINLPDGTTWVADDDSGGGLNPLVKIKNPPSGQYDIWVGSYRQNDYLEATLYISELTIDIAKKPVPFNPNLPDCYIISAGVDNYPFVNKLQGDLNDAKNTVAAFKGQHGTKFKNVHDQTLLDGMATHEGILQGFKNFTTKGAAGDYMVLFLSGHGGRSNNNNTWYFLPYDYHPQKYATTALTDTQILDAADQLVKQKKNVVVIVDACHCGQMNTTAQPYFAKYNQANQGGLILMLACTGPQTSAALGNYSTFAKAFSDCMAGAGDLSKNGTITLGEVKTYTKQRTDELVAGAKVTKQDPIVTWSPSISENLAFAYTGKVSLPTAKLPSTGTPTKWEGNETLPGFGKLTFTTYPNGKAVMVDAKNTTAGIWHKQNNQYTLSFANGAIVYTGTISGTTLSGTATSPGSREKGIRTWKWTVTQ